MKKAHHLPHLIPQFEFGIRLEKGMVRSPAICGVTGPTFRPHRYNSVLANHKGYTYKNTVINHTANLPVT
ncbi:MAG: hypothetical protein EXS31_16230 [Pedosphaera sp.]|nr:hypothetical protein [Pedosphaera sp.]